MQRSVQLVSPALAPAVRWCHVERSFHLDRRLRALQEAPAKVDNGAALQLQVTKANNPFLATLTAPGEAQFLTVLKPCGILLPHVHQRATEFYSILFGARSLASSARLSVCWQAHMGRSVIGFQAVVHAMSGNTHHNATYRPSDRSSL
jgi:hypothetical protein